MAESWFYLSFAAPAGFLGGCYLQSDTEVAAVRAAWRQGINPGGEVQIVGPIDADAMDENVPDTDRNRLLTREELKP
jgi:hypothetical protein